MRHVEVGTPSALSLAHCLLLSQLNFTSPVLGGELDLNYKVVKRAHGHRAAEVDLHPEGDMLPGFSLKVSTYPHGTHKRAQRQVRVELKCQGALTLAERNPTLVTKTLLVGYLDLELV